MNSEGRKKYAEQVFSVHVSVYVCARASVCEREIERGGLGGEREVISKWLLKSSETRVPVPVSN